MIKSQTEKLLGTNRKAFHDFTVEETLEAGIALLGTEVKALREGRLNLRDSYATVEKGSVVLHHCHIGAYSHGNRLNHDPLRPKRLLLHRKEIARIAGKVQQAGLTLIPLKMYVNPRGKVKVEIALARGKKLYDRREAIKKREATREIQRAMKSARSRSE